MTIAVARPSHEASGPTQHGRIEVQGACDQPAGADRPTYELPSADEPSRSTAMEADIWELTFGTGCRCPRDRTRWHG